MDFPEDIWNIVMSYFHSSYKKPSHYESIMDVSEFLFTRYHNRESCKQTLKWNKSSLIVDSYYMLLILNTHFHFSSKNKSNEKNKLRRGVASCKIRQDFKYIFETYKNLSKTNILRNLKYE